jgi:hypothetical protein
MSGRPADFPVELTLDELKQLVAQRARGAEPTPARAIPPSVQAERRRRDASALRHAALGQPTATCRNGVEMTEQERRQYVSEFERTRPQRVRRVFAALRPLSHALPVAARRQIPRRRCEGRRRPGTRRVVSRSAGGGSSGDSDEPEPARGRYQHLAPPRASVVARFAELSRLRAR